MGSAGFTEEFRIGVQDSLHGEFGMGIQDSSLGNLSGGSGFPVIHRDAILPRRFYSGMPEFKEGGDFPVTLGQTACSKLKILHRGCRLSSPETELFFFFFFRRSRVPPTLSNFMILEQNWIGC